MLTSGSRSTPLDFTLLSQAEPQAATDAIYRSLSGSYTHTLLEWTATSVALFAALLAFTHFGIKRDVVTPVIGVALFAAGMVDAFHTLAADRLIPATASNQDLIPFTWAISRSFNAVIPISALGMIMFARKYKVGTAARHSLGVVLLLSTVIGAAAYAIIHYCAVSDTLPVTMFPDALVTRPWDVIPLVVYVISGTMIYPLLNRQNPSYFAWALWLSVLPDTATQLHMAFGSTMLFDNHFNIVHFLKIVAYLVPCLGLVLDYIATYRTAELAEDKARARAEELGRSNAELEQFAYVASHDLQEPLRMVASYAELLSQRYHGKLDAKADKFIGYITEGSQRMQGLLKDLLSYSRAGRTAQPFVPTDTNKVLEDTRDNLQVAISESHAQVTWDRLPTVNADHTQLTQVFQNLVANAIKFRGDEDPSVHVSATHADGSWTFSVRDNGIGIEPEYSERIFMIFQRLHEREKYEGSGVGLAISKKIVERHGGHIRMESGSQQGTVSVFTIPDSEAA